MNKLVKESIIRGWETSQEMQSKTVVGDVYLFYSTVYRIKPQFFSKLASFLGVNRDYRIEIYMFMSVWNREETFQTFVTKNNVSVQTKLDMIHNTQYAPDNIFLGHEPDINRKEGWWYWEGGYPVMNIDGREVKITSLK